jgi:uncharacterized protein YndB with AHSA1/START domain
MTTIEETAATTQVYRVYIKASPQAIWDAITKPEWTERYGAGGRAEYDLRPGGRFRALAGEAMRRHGAAIGYDVPEVVIDGEVIEADPPRRLVQTWRMLADPAMAGESFTRLTWEIAGGDDGVSRLTVVHELDAAPRTAAMVSGSLEEQGLGGGWSWILSDLKSLLETGAKLRG